MWSDSPRLGNMGRFGVLGFEKESSLDTRRAGSRNAGDGDSVGFGASLKERGFGDFRPWLNDDKEVGVRSPSSSLCVKADFAMFEATCCSAMVVVDMVMCRKLRMWADEEVGGNDQVVETTCLRGIVC
jgi:hypothetical protein